MTNSNYNYSDQCALPKTIPSCLFLSWEDQPCFLYTISALQTTILSFTLAKIPKEISRWSMLFNNWRQYLPYQTLSPPFTIWVDWPEIRCLIRVSIVVLQILPFYGQGRFDRADKADAVSTGSIRKWDFNTL